MAEFLSLCLLSGCSYSTMSLLSSLFLWCKVNDYFVKVPNGIAHYLEHLKFYTETGSAFDYFSKLGSSVNAFTSYNVTCYEVFSSTYFRENLEYLLDYVGTPYFTILSLACVPQQVCIA